MPEKDITERQPEGSPKGGPNPRAKFLTCVRNRFYAFFASPDG